MYTGTYEDGETPTFGKLSSAALTPPGKVLVALDTFPGETEPKSEFTFEEDPEASAPDPVADCDESDNLGALDLPIPPRCLFLPLRLYVMADKYDVPALRLLARDRFYRSAECGRMDDDFPDVIDELFQTTRQNDTSLREIVCSLVGSKARDREYREKMDPVMRKHGDFAVGVLNYVLLNSNLPSGETRFHG
ncbi:hypothetical protein SODALDRAFT_192269 [Sodiomyces alkalinus F11]|uniref:BTB domain-containing protein n=1 Tax=Sodiomyces alkalinus (strain CBS 110278 / VKM F-3762 / F11) TaxID=1314773 RepID=A0A3N2PRX3_SODAK|nr:hypothetical protein SODALDRAFT_192269 [Sodiomyces alkalinus F11]ROT37238.1 hypothetical protein SODALDRAFT_192269 [Sodiomyces alkalinus F11]